jgi:ABC-type multidrug transport system fused ATPase/permease subunit
LPSKLCFFNGFRLFQLVLNKVITEETGGKSTIIISHRLATATLVDKIFVLSEGTIVEEGSHTELMELGGIYCKMFNIQSEKYIDNKEAYNA